MKRIQWLKTLRMPWDVQWKVTPKLQDSFSYAIISAGGPFSTLLSFHETEGCLKCYDAYYWKWSNIFHNQHLFIYVFR